MERRQIQTDHRSQRTIRRIVLGLLDAENGIEDEEKEQKREDKRKESSIPQKEQHFAEDAE